MTVKIQLKRDKAKEWLAVNPILAEGEIGIELDTARFKIGDGIKAWSDLTYAYANSLNLPKKVSELENDAEYITKKEIPTKLSDFENDQKYLKDISKEDIINALGFTPYNSINSSNYITSADLGDGTITLTQNGIFKGSFSTNQGGNKTIDLGSDTLRDKVFSIISNDQNLFISNNLERQWWKKLINKAKIKLSTDYPTRELDKYMIKATPDFVLVYLDISMLNEDNFLNNYTTLVSTTMQKYLLAKIFCCNFVENSEVEHDSIIKYNKLIQDICFDLGVNYIDLHSCGITQYNKNIFYDNGKLNEVGNTLVTDKIYSVLNNYF